MHKLRSTIVLAITGMGLMAVALAAGAPYMTP